MPKHLRKILGNPIKNGGVLASGSPEQSIPSTIPYLEMTGAFEDNKLKFICVGDVVSKAFYEIPELRKYVKYFIIDGVTQRGTKEFSFNFHFLDNIEYVQFENRPGTISTKVLYFMGQTCRDDHQYIIEIKGEEDLLTIPAITFRLKSDPHYVFYGQPPFTDMGTKLPAGLVTVWTVPFIRKINAEHFNQFTRQMWT